MKKEIAAATEICGNTQTTNSNIHLYVSKCRTEYSILTGNYFEEIHMEMKHIFDIFWLWAAECNSKTASQIINWYIKKFYLSAISFFKRYQFLETTTNARSVLGGPGIVVKVEKSVIERDKWVMGTNDTSTKKGIVIYIAYRRSETYYVILKHL